MTKPLLKNNPEGIIKSLNTPAKIQDFLDALPFNHERYGETCRSAEQAVIHNKAHCLEGAYIACAALKLQNKPTKIISIKVKPSDYDHVITLYKENGYWGALSKTNHAVLGYRDPIYRTIRELMMTYFHEYYLISTGEKTMLGYTRPITLSKFGTDWITSTNNLFTIAYAIADTPYIKVVPQANGKKIRNANKLECKASSIPAEGILQ